MKTWAAGSDGLPVCGVSEDAALEPALLAASREKIEFEKLDWVIGSVYQTIVLDVLGA